MGYSCLGEHTVSGELLSRGRFAPKITDVENVTKDRIPTTISPIKKSTKT